MTHGPKPGAESNQNGKEHRYTYDAWNRLVKVEERTYASGSPGSWSTVQTNEFDGLDRRIVRIDVAASDTFDCYYNDQWQLLEERKDGGGTPLNQFVWHPYYVDALAVRYYNGGSPYFALHDANFNVTAVVNDNGDVLERYKYTPYGQVTFLNDDCTCNPTWGVPWMDDLTWRRDWFGY